MPKGFSRITLVLLVLVTLLSTILVGCSSGNNPAATTTATTTSAAPTTTASQTTTAAPTTTAVTTAATTAATNREFRIGIMGGLTGTGKSAVVPMMEEFANVLKYTNEVEGGIDGAKLVWQIVDNQGTPDGAILAYKQLRDSFKPDLYMVIEDYLYTGIKDMIEEDKSVIICTASLQNTLYNPPGRFFSMSLATADGFAAYSKWVLADWKQNHADQTRNPKVGVLYWDMPSGLQWKVAEGWVKSQGVDLVPVAFPMTSIDLKTQFMQLRDSGVDYIWMQAITQQAAMAIRDYSGLGLNGKIPMTFMEMSEAQPLIALVGQGTKGFYCYRSENPSSEGSQAAKLWTAIYKWSHSGEEKWADNRLTITFKAILTAALKQAAADVGWDKVNNESIYTALTELTTIDTWGNTNGFGFGLDKRMGISSMKMVQFTGTDTVAVGDPITLPRVFEGIDK